MEDEILAAIDRWLEREVKPHVMALEHADVWPEKMVEQMNALGLFGATISPPYGGLLVFELSCSGRRGSCPVRAPARTPP